MKTLYMSNGTNDYSVTTKAKTEKGYWAIAQKRWPYTGMVNLRIRVEDDTVNGDPVIYEGKKVIYR